MKSRKNILEDIIRIFHKQTCRSILMGILCVSMTVSGLFLGSAEAKGTKVTLSKQQEAKVVALLGDLNENAPDSVKNELRQLVYEAETCISEREAAGNYVIPIEEGKVWEDITILLDNESMRHLGGYYYEAEDDKESTGQTVDYGKNTMNNLKQRLSKGDWNELNKIRNDYFAAIENDTQGYDVDTDFEIKAIINKYKELDADAIVLNVLDAKNQQNVGMFKITPELDAVYQKGTENGLKLLGTEQQASLKKIWRQTTNILPKELFANFKYFKVGGDGELGTQAYVMPLDSEGKSWCMVVDPADITEDGYYPYTVVHEMAHYITLNENQVEYFSDELYPMDRYEDRLCVADEDSYLQAFYKLFWRDIITDWYIDSDNPYFYYRHQSEFVTGYASTDCTEDMAESFSAYVLLDKAPTPETQAKMDFFDSYPELKAIKRDILNNIKKNGVYVNPEIQPSYKQEDGSAGLDTFIKLMIGITEIMTQ